MKTQSRKFANKEVRIWLDGLPHILATNEFSKTVVQCDATQLREYVCAIEVRTITEPPMYGLLGGHFRPNPGQFSLSITIVEDKETLFRDTIALKGDSVYWRFPAEFAESTKASITRHKEMPCGHLEVCCAASAEISSNQVIFSFLGEVLMTAVTRQLEADEILDLVGRLSVMKSWNELKH